MFAQLQKSRLLKNLTLRTNNSRNEGNNELLNATLKDVEHIYRDIAGFDMSYHVFKSLCREAWKKIQLFTNK